MNQRREAFTIVEILVVVLIMATLVTVSIILLGSRLDI